MATLNTLRTKGGLIVTIVIGLALVAFLLGDLSGADSMLNSRKTQVGEINGTKIGQMEYVSEVDRLTIIEQAMSGKDALSTEDQERVREMAWENLIHQYAMRPGYDDLGMLVGEAEATDMVSGAYLSPIVQQIFTNPNTGMFDPAMMGHFVSNLSQDVSGRSSLIWEYLKDQMTRQRLLGKYIDLVGAGLYTTDLEVEEAVALANHSSDIAYISREYHRVADSLVNVSESEVRDYYRKHRRLMRQSASRDIEYVVFDVLPSEQDYADAERFVTDLAIEFESTDSPMQYAMLNSQGQPSAAYVGENQAPANLVSFAFGPNASQMYGPVKDGDTYTLARVVDTRMMPDTIGASHILITDGNTALADSLERVLRAGGNFAALAEEYSADDQTAVRGGELGNFPPEMMIPAFSEAALAVNTGQLFRAETPYGIHIGKLTYKSRPVKKVQLATITYQIEPSEATQQIIYAQASKFLSEAAGSYENFQAATTENALAKRVARLRNTDREISGMNNSREVVRWAFNAKVGEVSQIMDVNGDYLVAALDKATDDGYAPITQVSSEIAQQLRIEKKGLLVADSLASGSSLAEVAGRLGAEIKQAQGIEFNNFYIEGLGAEPAIIGAVSTVEPGKLAKPVMGYTGVFLFEVTASEAVPTTTPEGERARLQAMGSSYLNERISQALIESSNIVDKRVKFF